MKSQHREGREAPCPVVVVPSETVAPFDADGMRSEGQRLRHVPAAPDATVHEEVDPALRIDSLGGDQQRDRRQDA